MEVGRLDHGQIHRTEYLKETVRQGNGLDEAHNLSDDAMQRGWDCLARFAERLADFKHDQVRAVATQTLREAKNRDVFIDRAQTILGFPIDVVSGREEARLIYQGVSHLLPQSNERRLVIDIGGRSSELILGQGLEAHVMGSYRVGSVAWSMNYFPDGQMSAGAFKNADIAAKAVLDEVANLYANTEWDVAYGSSGTVGAVGDILAAAGWPADKVTREGLQWLIDKLSKAGHIDKLKLIGLKDERRAVIGGGVSVLKAMFDLLKIDTLNIAQGALRHGALYDLLDRDLSSNDLRSASVTRLVQRFEIEPLQAERVAHTAKFLLAQLLPALSAQGFDTVRLQKKLAWAAQLHEIGCLISHDSYHKHGAYIIDNVDAAGFALHELHRLSMLVLGHRGKLKKVGDCLDDASFTAQLLCLRLAVIICHARGDVTLKGIVLNVSGKTANKYALTLPRSWRTQLPQTVYLLNAELEAWSKTGWALSLSNDT
jgi:exopolyphosphatase/guanosine-5'-triphosphate,3'-diphosphate pyrophosphatase